MKTINKFLLVASLALFPLLAKAVDVQSTSTPVFINWTDGVLNDLYVNLSLASDPGGLFTGNMTFDLHLYAEGNAPQLGYVQVENNNKIEITDTQYLRVGSEVNAGSIFGTGGPNFFYDPSFESGAIGGSDNYIGIKFLDNNSEAHYGWIQLNLNAFSDGGVAAGFVAGHVNNDASTSSWTGSSVPEPSTLALLAAAGAGLALIARSRRK